MNQVIVKHYESLVHLEANISRIDISSSYDRLHVLCIVAITSQS